MDIKQVSIGFEVQPHKPSGVAPVFASPIPHLLEPCAGDWSNHQYVKAGTPRWMPHQPQ